MEPVMFMKASHQLNYSQKVKNITLFMELFCLYVNMIKHVLTWEGCDRIWSTCILYV